MSGSKETCDCTVDVKYSQKIEGIPHNQDVNLIITNNTTSPKHAFGSINRPQGILRKPSDWRVIVERFNINFYEVPIASFVDGKWSVTLSVNGGGAFQQNLVYIQTNFPENPLYPPNPIFDINTFEEMMNVALAGAFATMLAAGGITATAPPVFEFDENTARFNLYVPALGYDLGTGGAGLVQIWFNYSLATSLPKFYTSFFEGLPNGMEVRLNPRRSARVVLAGVTGTNGEFYDPTVLTSASDYVVMTQESPSLDALSEYNRIIVQTSTLPVRNTFIEGFTGATGNATIPILTDFIIDLDSSSTDRGSYTLSSSNARRFVDLISDNPLYSIDLSVYFASKTGMTYPLLIPPNDSFGFLLIFNNISSNFVTPMSADPKNNPHH